jgi:hypothetical protein
MDRRTFDKLISTAALGSETHGAKALAEAQPGPSFANDGVKFTTEWPGQVYRRLLIDTHIPDWDPLFLTRFDTAEYVDTIVRGGFQQIMPYTNSCVGLALWKTQVGQMHANLHGRDMFGEIVTEARRRGLHTAAYFIVTRDNWAAEKHPAWRLMPPTGNTQILTHNRYGQTCANTPYRDYAFACLREIVGNYPIEGVFIDMTFWRSACYCASCTERFWNECKAEPPRVIDWNDPLWRKFQAARERWMLEFAQDLTNTIKKVRPITVYHNQAVIFDSWSAGQSPAMSQASDYLGGDIYDGPAFYSLVSKAYDGLTPTHPFEFMTSRTGPGLAEHVTQKSLERLRMEAFAATLHSAALTLIDAINPVGTLNPNVYKLLARLNEERAPYEPFLGGELQADMAIYFDHQSMYDPAKNGIPVGDFVGWEGTGEKGNCPHRDAILGWAKVLREAHIPYGVVTNVNIEKLKNYRAVIVPSVLEMTAEQAATFSQFVKDGGVMIATGSSSLDRFDPKGPRFLLEDVLGVRYLGTMGTKATFLTPTDAEVTRVVWPQDYVMYSGPMMKAEALSGAEVLATVTLPWVAPELGQSIGSHFASIHSNPPALEPSESPALVVNGFGRGRCVWLAAPIETGQGEVNPVLLVHLIKRVLPGPYKFEADTHPSVEMTLFHQQDKKRLLVGLLSMQDHLPAIPVGATVRVRVPAGKSITGIYHLPERKLIEHRAAGDYVEVRLKPFDLFAMLLAEYS